ncbi:MAG: efflux RND transporter periplasmic adaptor subunit [Candidatus Eisenbacteria bacterium]|uniref:Efflux RND transporter periplasmic adaptor subunit n=1 Tax=Eiseniibacteriota bacterium TaxID=2212470 RepID=A0A849STY5_UNCEI|nr:efflux RND transporter periplasmic adaptor subunit [Candidatus Eisenbacteria bacterium]
MQKRMIQMLAIVVVVVAILGFIKFQQIQAAMSAGKSFQPPPETVTTVVAKSQDWQGHIEAVGAVAPAQGVTLSADLPGVVEKISFQSGARVSKGQALVLLDSRQERAQLASARAKSDLAKLSLDRGRKLFESGSIAQAELDQVEAQFKQADADADEIEATIGRKTIRAPFSGTAGIRQVNLGQYLHSGDPVVPVQSMDPIYVDFSVPQQQVASLRVGASVQAASDSGARATLTGRITAINPVVDDATRNIQVQATFSNPRGVMRSGMYVTVKVMLSARSEVIALPSSAINFAPYGNSVFIVEDVKGPDGKTYRGVRQQFVKLGTAQGDQVAVLDGVKAGEEIVTSGVFKLRTGAAVVVNNTVQPGNSPAPKPADS